MSFSHHQLKYLGAMFTLLYTSFNLLSQDYHYPSNGNWDTKDPAEMGWCEERVDSLNDFLERRNSKAFIVLHKGEIVLEEYYGSFTADSLWYWASAGKSLMGFLLGVAQQDGLLSINHAVSDHLGTGWTSCTNAQELQIKIRHQISMTTGLQDQLKPTVEIPDPANCLEPECLQYETAPNAQWAYHNAPYRLTQDVLEKASGLNSTLYTFNTLRDLDFRGAWINYVFFSKAREMAKFGLLALSEGKWNGKAILRDTAYFRAMTHSSQSINPAYGYLWWLNGQKSYRLPGLDLDFNGSMVPDAPADMYAALGKNDQKIYVVPSKDLVVVRMGNSAFDARFALSSFDKQLWQYINALDCPTSANPLETVRDLKMYPNPCAQSTELNVHTSEPVSLQVLSLQGSLLYESSAVATTHKVSTDGWAKGTYLLKVQQKGVYQRQLFTVY